MSADVTITDFKHVLKEELAARCRQNPRYSLRAFARDLKLAPSRLSEILSGKQGLSREAALKVAAALGYAAGETERFVDLVEAQHARSRKDRDAAKIRLRKHAAPTPEHLLQLDAFAAIADWYHFGLLELLQLSDFKSDTKWIAKRLGITEFEVQLAIERLTRLGLISRKGGRLVLTHDTGLVPGDIPSESTKKFHAQILKKATEAVWTQFDRREYRSFVLAVDSARLPDAKKAIREFQHKFCKSLAEDESKDALYCLAIQFFELGDSTSP